MSALKSSLIAIVIACLPFNAIGVERYQYRSAVKPAIAPMPTSESEQIKDIVDNLLRDNDEFAKAHNVAYFNPLIAGQMPRATVVTCSDSRVHTHALDKTPDGDLFMVRNIGNQLLTSEGSVEYGVHHLHTPLLIIIGHSSCGAIKAASGNYTKESRAIRRELDRIKISKGKAGIDGVLVNVNNQVAAALRKFRPEVKRGELTVIGAVYDFANDLGRGFGKLNVVNLNGETDSARIGDSKLLSGTTPGGMPVTGKTSSTSGGGGDQTSGVTVRPAAYAYP